MFAFRNNPDGTARSVKATLITFIVAAAAFWLIEVYLVPLIGIEPLQTFVRVGVVLLAILFIVDFFV